MKENTKIIIACVITLILATVINVTATTLLQADSISYKTSNGDTTDVNSALDRLFDAADINQRLGNTDISNIGDGTVTGAVSALNRNLGKGFSYNSDDDYIYINGIKWRKAYLKSFVIIGDNGFENDISQGKAISYNGMSSNKFGLDTDNRPICTLVTSFLGWGFISNIKIDMTNYTKLKVIFAVNGVQQEEATLDVTNVTGENYVFAQAFLQGPQSSTHYHAFRFGTSISYLDDTITSANDTVYYPNIGLGSQGTRTFKILNLWLE